MSEWCVCSASHGHPPGSRSRLASWSRRTISRGAGRAVAGVDEQRREVVGLDRPIEVGELDRGDALVGEPEPLQHRDRRRGIEVLEQRQLHVGQHEGVVALRDEQRARELPSSIARAVDHAPSRAIGSTPTATTRGRRQAHRSPRRSTSPHAAGLVQSCDGTFSNWQLQHHVDEAASPAGAADTAVEDRRRCAPSRRCTASRSAAHAGQHHRDDST